MKKLLSVVLTAFALVSCAKDIVELSGDIQGIVKDYNYGQFISNCQVSLSPSGKMTTTDNVGVFGFADIEPGEYVLGFSKAGYVEESIKVTVVTGQITEASIMLKAKSPFSLSETSLDFGDMEASKAIYVYNNTDSDCTYSVSNVPSWISLNPLQGTLPAGSNATIIVTVDRDNVGYGSHSQILSFNYTGKGSGSVLLSVEMEKVKLSAPKVSCGSLAENIKETSFDISGSILATGGQMVTSYGHCWSLTPNPTIADNRTNNGSTVATGDFKSTITDLTAFTTYYVRAYAENAMGVSYSNEISVTTQDVHSDKWDGTMANSFAGGSGTFADPYIIKTGGHLLLMQKYPDKNYALANNINLDNINWKPFEFSGTLDGKGFIISNLYIKRNDDYQGLFSRLGYESVVKNLTIKGVRIDAADNSYIGTVAGHCEGEIRGCKVIFVADSFIKGKNLVGGISGYDRYESRRCHVFDCNVTSQKSDVAIIGNNSVGGIVGKGICQNSHASVDVLGSTSVGGLIGSTGVKEDDISASSFSGSVRGESEVGGIVGHCRADIISCKSTAEIYVETGHAGGICGRYERDDYYDYGIYIAGCYADGTIVPSSGSTVAMGGITTSQYGSDAALVYHSYSTVMCSSANFDGIGINEDDRIGNYEAYDCCAVTDTEVEGSNNQSFCTDITTFMKDCYSEYAGLWNFNNTWTWKGKINGKEVSVSCPRLAWEQ